MVDVAFLFNLLLQYRINDRLLSLDLLYMTLAIIMNAKDRNIFSQ